MEEHYDIAKHHVFLICFIQQISLGRWPVATYHMWQWHTPFVKICLLEIGHYSFS